jgi:hypothetical protein
MALRRHLAELGGLTLRDLAARLVVSFARSPSTSGAASSTCTPSSASTTPTATPRQ